MKPDQAWWLSRSQLQMPVLVDLLVIREAFFLRTDAAILARQIGGALQQAAVRTLVDVDFAAEARLHGRPKILCIANRRVVRQGLGQRVGKALHPVCCQESAGELGYGIAVTG